MDEVKECYSYHNFIFPFIWENSKTKVDEKKSIEKYFKNNEYWQSGIPDNHRISKKEWIDLYSRNEYFHSAFREAILGYDDEFKIDKSIVLFYEFAPEIIENGAEYIIIKSYEDDATKEIKKKEYHLDIRRISIKIFNTGIAVLILECVNYRYHNLKDIKWINDYGRRTSLPFVPEEENEKSRFSSICADSLKIRIRGKNNASDLLYATESFLDRIQEIYEQEEFTIKDIQEQSSHVCNWIDALLKIGGKERCPFVSDETGEVKIYPALDERMYVMCLIHSGKEERKEEKGDLIDQILSDSEEAKKIRRSSGDCLEWMNLSHQETLYELAYVDANYCTCQSDLMRKELLQKCIYDRWIKYGTIYTVTPQAFLCISNNNATIKSFCNMYLDMCVLSLVQRATLINFQDIALSLSKGLEEIGKVIDTKKIKELLDLQERFIAFQNQINLQEISSQEQAVELYKKLREASFVEELAGALKEQLDALYDATNTNQDYSFNKWALLFAIVTLGIDVPTFLFRTDGTLSVFPMEWSGTGILSQIGPHLIIFTITAIAFGYIFHKFKRKKRK